MFEKEWYPQKPTLNINTIAFVDSEFTLRYFDIIEDVEQLACVLYNRQSRFLHFYFTDKPKCEFNRLVRMLKKADIVLEYSAYRMDLQAFTKVGFSRKLERKWYSFVALNRYGKWITLKSYADGHILAVSKFFGGEQHHNALYDALLFAVSFLKENGFPYILSYKKGNMKEINKAWSAGISSFYSRNRYIIYYDDNNIYQVDLGGYVRYCSSLPDVIKWLKKKKIKFDVKKILSIKKGQIVWL